MLLKFKADLVMTMSSRYWSKGGTLLNKGTLKPFFII